jgi:amino acid transporter
VPSKLSSAAELGDYVSISAGMAIACSGYTVMAELSGIVTGVPYLIAIAAAGALCMAISGSIAFLASSYPSAPGVRTYLRGALGDFPSLLATFTVLAIVPLFAGAESYTLALSLRSVIPISPYVLAPAAILFVVSINLFGLQLPRTIQFALGVALIAGTLLLGGMALLGPMEGGAPLPAAPVRSGAEQAARALTAVGSAVFLYTGFEWVTPLGRGPAAYRRLIPISMPLALGILMVMYVLFAAGLQRRLAPGELASNPIPHMLLGERVAGARGILLAAVLSALSTLTTFNAGLMGASRLLYALAREGKLPRFVSHISMRTGVPAVAVLLIGGAALLAALVEILLDLQVAAAIAAAALYCLVYASFVWAGLRHRARDPSGDAHFRNPVPRAVQWGLCLALPLLAVATAASDGALRPKVMTGVTVVLASCLLLARWSFRAGNQARPARAVLNQNEAR